MKTALNSLFCAATADKKSRWPHSGKARFSGVQANSPEKSRVALVEGSGSVGAVVASGADVAGSAGAAVARLARLRLAPAVIPRGTDLVRRRQPRVTARQRGRAVFALGLLL